MSQALSDAGLELVPVGPDSVDLLVRRPGGESVPVEFKVSSHVRPLTPSDIQQLANDRPPTLLLLIVPTATAAARAAAASAGWSIIALNPNRDSGPQGQVRISPDHIIEVGKIVPSGKEAERRPGPIAWGTITLLRRLLENPSATQSQLAEQTGVSQPRVSQALKPLVQDGLIQRVSVDGRPRWITSNWDALLERWLASYPGPGGISSFWYGLETPTEQAATAVTYLTRLAKADPTRHSLMLNVVVSGDVAADQVSPWRRPRRAIIYVRRGADLSKVGLTPAGEEEATLELVVPKDPGVWPIEVSASRRRVTREFLPLADPLQILWDLRRAPGADSDQAAEHLLAALRTHAHDATQEKSSDVAQDLWTEVLPTVEPRL